MLVKTASAGLLLAAAMSVSGCSESGFADVFNSGKFSPDETSVPTNKALTAPPDLQLRPPSGGGAAPRPQAPVAAQPTPYTAPPAANTAYAAPQTPAYQPAPPGQPAPLTNAPAAPQPGYAVPAQPRQVTQNDPYIKYGISRYRADGSKKTQAELDNELRRKYVAAKKRNNPNYGTIFNLGALWRDD